MWIGEVDFDGETISGVLMNAPNYLTSVKQGDAVRVPFAILSDWMMTADRRAYGGFTVQLLRAGMGRPERKQHDEAWGLDFGEPTDVRVELVQAAKGGFLSGLFGGRKSGGLPAAFQDHPMCVNTLPKYDEQLRGDPEIARNADEEGWTLLHRDALAGNLGVVKLYVQYGADVAARTNSGRTAAELARGIGWEEVADYLEQQGG